ncbi:hypothetical protein OL548_20725 [Lysinibacillus sp. MHQ-1]|nr:hypothetical protein OL548_20725 [Lysinibacillus sp. MHQ-1]
MKWNVGQIYGRGEMVKKTTVLQVEDNPQQSNHLERKNGFRAKGAGRSHFPFIPATTFRHDASD